MKWEDLVSDRERELMKDYFENRGPERKLLTEVVGIYDKDQGKMGMDSTVYMFFDPILTDEMLEIMRHMKLREKIYVEDLAKRCKLPVDYVAKVTAEIAKLGPIEYWADENGVDMLYLPQLCVGALEWVMVGDAWWEHPEQALLFEHETFESFTGKGIYLPITNHGVHRAVPIESAIVNEPKKMEWEELTKLVEKNNPEKIFCVGRCVCRQGMEVNGNGSGEPTNEWCTAFGHFGKYLIDTGKAKQITEEEFWNIIKSAEDRGFVHNVANANGVDIEYVCNCDFRTCYTLRADLYSSNSSMTRGNFVAQVNPDNCVACGRCVERCPMNAVKLGQRLAPTDGSKYYHYQTTPHEYMKWGEDKWHPNYQYERKETWVETGTAPCKTACPAHIGVEGYLKLAKEGRYDDALKLIKYNNPLPAVCGAICNRRCEDACTRGCIDEPVAIDEVKKFLAYRELKAENRYIPAKEPTLIDHGAKVAVIGAGPAGLSAAYYLQVMGDEVTVFEKNKKLGGMLQYGIPSFRLEKDVLEAEIEVIKELGAEFRTGVEVGKDVTIEQLREEGYQAFYIAIGMQGGRALGIAGEDAEGVQSGVAFMRDTTENGKGECEGDVIVVGGGNVAVDVARTAARSGAKSVKMFCLESREEMPAADDEVREAEEENIEVNCGWGPKEILVKKGKVSGIVFKRCTSVFDNAHRFNPQYDENDTITLDADTVLTSIGQSVEWGGLLKGIDLELRPNQCVMADDFTYQTTEEDIFVGGDVYTGARFAIDAIAAGKEAAKSIHRYVWSGNLRTGRNNLVYSEMDKLNADYGSYDNGGRQVPGVDKTKIMSFSDNRDLFTEEQVKAETERCLQCGASHVDENMCIGCGVCTTRCEFDAIHLRRVFEERPVVREKLVPAVLGEIGRRLVWTKMNNPQPKVVKVGPDIDENVSNATGAVYHKPGATAADDQKVWNKALRKEDRILKKEELKGKFGK